MPNDDDTRRRRAAALIILLAGHILQTAAYILLLIHESLIPQPPRPYHTSVLSGHGWVQELIGLSKWLTALESREPFSFLAFLAFLALGNA
jgi:hypothetical protein